MKKNTFHLFKNILSISVVMILAENFAVSATQVFEPWADEVFVAIGREYGPAAEKRFRKVMEIILTNQDKPIMEKIKLTNDFLNNIPWIADQDHWKSEDYWATPFETLATFGGDCEDIAIAKFAMLRMMGIPEEALGFAYVETREKEHHMVLIFRENITLPVYVLDNQVPELLTGPERRDLTAIYIFQNDGKIYLIGDDGKKRYIKKEFKGKKFEKWTSAKERARENRKKYEKYNNNKPLFPGD